MSRPFEARYAGICAACTERFGAGDTVMFHEDEICHVDCPDPLARGGRETVCVTCFLTSCDCGAE